MFILVSPPKKGTDILTLKERLTKTTTLQKEHFPNQNHLIYQNNNMRISKTE